MPAISTRSSVTHGALAAAGLSLLVAACAGLPSPVPVPQLDPPSLMYAATEDDGFKVAAVSYKRIDPKYLRQVVDTPPQFNVLPDTIVIDPANRFLYLTMFGGKSVRYGIGVGRQGFAWSGEATIGDKQHWPKWFPPKEMIDRDPTLKPYKDGQDGGPRNPLGARAMYLWANGVDTLYRIHGTNQPSSIGKAVSSGCVRMLDQDVMDLYERVGLGAKVVVLPASENPDDEIKVGVSAPPLSAQPPA